MRTDHGKTIKKIWEVISILMHSLHVELFVLKLSLVLFKISNPEYAGYSTLCFCFLLCILHIAYSKTYKTDIYVTKWQEITVSRKKLFLCMKAIHFRHFNTFDLIVFAEKQRTPDRSCCCFCCRFPSYLATTTDQQMKWSFCLLHFSTIHIQVNRTCKT